MSEPGASLFEDTDPKTEALASEEAEIAVAQGRVISHQAIRKWLLSWGKADELSPPRCGE